MPRIIMSVGEIKATAITPALFSIVIPTTRAIVIGICATISTVVISVAVTIIVLTRAISAIAATIIAIISPCCLADYEGANNRKA